MHQYELKNFFEPSAPTWCEVYERFVKGNSSDNSFSSVLPRRMNFDNFIRMSAAHKLIRAEYFQTSSMHESLKVINMMMEGISVTSRVVVDKWDELAEISGA